MPWYDHCIPQCMKLTRYITNVDFFKHEFQASKLNTVDSLIRSLKGNRKVVRITGCSDN